jgi:hypothetical protein
MPVMRWPTETERYLKMLFEENATETFNTSNLGTIIKSSEDTLIGPKLWPL